MKVQVRLDWLIDVRGTDNENDAASIVADYVSDLDGDSLFESLEIEPYVEPDGPEELTITLFPEDEEIPLDGEPWSTYNPSPYR
jgi:hypothetical protein